MKTAAPLTAALAALETDGRLPMHMPGHKRQPISPCLPYHMDITEIDGFDDLHHPEGLILQMQEKAAALYRASAAFPLVGGSTCGILAAIRAAVPDGAAVLVQRQSHRSVFHAIEICRLTPVWLEEAVDPDSGIGCGVTPECVEASLSLHPEAAAVIVTCPSYEGVVSDLEGICLAAHAKGLPVICDAAHGAHLGFDRRFPRSPSDCGADAVILSLHKTLPSLTQTALALLCGDRISQKAMADQLAVFETSSPSYLLLSSIEICLSLLEEQAGDLFSSYYKMLQDFDARISGLRHLKVLCHGSDSSRPFRDFDPGKLNILTGHAGITGPQFAHLLREQYCIEPEMVTSDSVLCMTSICDTPETLGRLAEALLDMDRQLSQCQGIPFLQLPPLPEKVFDIGTDRALVKERCAPFDAVGRISAAYVWAYPPGRPLIVPGERISAGLIDFLQAAASRGILLRDSCGCLPSALAVTQKS